MNGIYLVSYQPQNIIADLFCHICIIPEIQLIKNYKYCTVKIEPHDYCSNNDGLLELKLTMSAKKMLCQKVNLTANSFNGIGKITVKNLYLKLSELK